MRAAPTPTCRAAVAAAILGLSTPARAADPKPVLPPPNVTGLESPAVEPGDGSRELAAAMLFLPRKTVEMLFLASGAAAAVIRDRQVVPRVSELLAPKPGDLSAFPLLIFDTRRRTSVGAQMIASGDRAATRLSLGFGGVHDLVGEARQLFTGPKPIPFVFSLDGLADSRSRLDWLGVGQDPEHDPRNHFVRGAASHESVYWERRSRGVASLGARANHDVEVLFSIGYTQSYVTDSPDHDPQSIGRVFAKGTVNGAPGTSRILYSEAALRLDTRPTLGRPSGGVLLEGYGGTARGVGSDPSRFLRMGGRGALFIPILRSTNILSPQLVVDGLVAPDDLNVPFTELVGQPDFRGIDTRRDHVSYVLSFDYRWSVLRYLGARLFVDFAGVAPDAAHVFSSPPRPAAGFGVELFSSSSVLGQFQLSGSADGVSAFLSFGVPSRFGDRQHRY